MDMNEPGAAVLALFSQLIDRVKQTEPMRSDDKPLKGGRVYSMQTLGTPVDPFDYKNPWNPQGASAPTPVIPPPTASTTASATAAATDGTAPDSPATLEASRALAAAYNTSVLCTRLLQVTDDQTYEEYPVGKDMNFAYNAVLYGAQPCGASEPDDPAVVAAIAKANAVLYLPNADGTPSVNPTPMYQNYQINSQAYGNAVGAYATAYGIARESPSQMATWPVASRPLQMAVTMARQTLISQGSAQVEGALDSLASVGFPYQARLVSAARAAYQDWSLPLAGSVAALNLYSQILPSDWASDDPGACRAWETLSVSSSDYNSIDIASSLNTSQFSWFNKASSVGGSANASFLGFIKLGGGASSSSSSQGSQSSSGQSASNKQFTDAKGLTITMTYALCTVQRPWFVGDLFYMRDWYLKGAQANSVSTGNIEDQLDPKNPRMMPMVPQQLLVVRNVKIQARQWGSVEQELSSAFGKTAQGSSTKSNSQAGSAGFSLGFISFGGSASHSSTSAQGSGGSVAGSNSSNSVSFNALTSTLTIPGAQILGWLCDITPASAPKDDPMYGKTAPSTTTSTTSGTSTSPATSGTAATPAPVPVGAAG